MSELNDDDSTGDGNSQVHEEVETEQGYVMQLTKNEALFLDDGLTLMVEREGDEQRVYSMRPVQMTARLAVPLDLMDKIGKAVVYTTTPENQEKEYAFAIDITELFMIREVASSFIEIEGEPVGLNLKRKICVLLYAKELEQEGRNALLAQLLTGINLDIQTPAIDGVDS
jgi:hypothetical protein